MTIKRYALALDFYLLLVNEVLEKPTKEAVLAVKASGESLQRMLTEVEYTQPSKKTTTKEAKEILSCIELIQETMTHLHRMVRDCMDEESQREMLIIGFEMMESLIQLMNKRDTAEAVK